MIKEQMPVVALLDSRLRENDGKGIDKGFLRNCFPALFCLLWPVAGFAASADVDPLANPPTPAFAGQTGAQVPAMSHEYQSEVVVTDLQLPRALVTLPDGDMLLAQGDGQAWLLSPAGEMAALSGMPQVHAVAGRGFSDLTLDADFADNRYVYLSYQAPPEGEPRIARARLSEDKQSLEDVEVIAEIAGRRLLSAPDGTLYMSTQGYGDNRYRIQDMSTLVGKVLRINSDGSIPGDNPFLDTANARPEIFSVGHRDPDGMAWHPQTGELWMVEHGPMGGDEVNVVRAGRNYGWPAITYGKNYDGTEISGSAAPGLEQPLYYWFPSLALSGLMFYEGEEFPLWQDSLFVGTMSPSQGKFLVRLVLDGEKVVAEEHLLVDHDRRVRAVTQGPDGAIYVLTDSEDNDDSNRHFPGEVLRLTLK